MANGVALDVSTIDNVRESLFSIEKQDNMQLQGKNLRKTIKKHTAYKGARAIAKVIKSKSGLEWVLEKDNQAKFNEILNSFKKQFGFRNFGEVYDFISHDRNFREIMNFVTVRVSSFFRQKEGFDYIIQNLKNIQQRCKNKEFKVLVAGCSTGEEAYTLAMILNEHLPKGYRYNITATDISSKAVESAIQGNYSAQKVEKVEPYFLNKYFDYNMDNHSYIVRKGMLNVNFLQGNILERLPEDWGNFDIVSCRNVLIYFDHKDRLKVLRSFNKVMKSDALLITGEPLIPNSYFSEVEKFIYRKNN